ncbi:hypothetical protein GIB67_022055, partial [Kingdonia uniflora]
VAELIEFMAKNQSFSYCKVVEVIAETIAPLTPMGELLLTSSTVTDKEPSKSVVQLTRTLSPYTMYKYLKPPTSLTPTLSTSPSTIKEREVDSKPVESMLDTLSILYEPPNTVFDKDSIEPKVQNGRALSPYIAYEDVKPPTSPTSIQPNALKHLRMSYKQYWTATDISIPGQNQTIIETEPTRAEVQKIRLLSSYAFYEDLKPPSSPTPTPSTSKEQITVVPPKVEALPPPNEGSGEKELLEILHLKTSHLSPYHAERLNSMNLMLYMFPISVVILLPAVLVMKPGVLDVIISLGNAKDVVIVVISIILFQNPVILVGIVQWIGLKSSWLMVQNCLKARTLLAGLGIQVTVADARFCKPLDIKLVRQLCEEHSFLVTVEEGSVGGFGSHVAQFIVLNGKLDGRIKWRPIVLPDKYIEQASQKEQLSLAGLTGHHIAATALGLLGRTRDALLLMC